jgi:cytochrome P450
MHNETMKIALHVITAAGYGYSFEWDGSSEIPLGHQMSFRESIHITLDNLVTLIAVPRLLLNVPIPHLQRTKKAYLEFGKYLRDLVDLGKRRHSLKSGNNSILSELVAHSADSSEDSKTRPLTDDEIIGNAFIFLLAGHETT